MTEKLTYFDVVAYVVPGAALVAVVAYLLRLHGLLPAGFSGNDFIDGVGYLALALVAGHLIQAAAQIRFERRRPWPLRPVFHQGRPSEAALIFPDDTTTESRTYGRRILTRSKATRVLACLVSTGLLCEADRQMLIGATKGTSDLRQLSHQSYRTLYARLTAVGKSDKADRANADYNMYRGLSQGSRYIGWACLLSGAVQALRLFHLPDLHTVLIPPLPTGIGITAFGLLALWADRVFVGRAIGAGINHVREVFDLAEFAVEGLSQSAPGDQPVDCERGG